MTKSRFAEARLSPNHIRFDAGVASAMMPSLRSCAWVANVGDWDAGLVPGGRVEDMDGVKLSGARAMPHVPTPHRPPPSKHSQSRTHGVWQCTVVVDARIERAHLRTQAR
jgi:hypothetical protein